MCKDMRKLQQLCCFLLLGQLTLAAANVTTSTPRRGARANLLSFNPIGKEINMGLDFQMPFMRMPMKKYNDTRGNPVALLNVNTAAVITTGLLAAGGIVVGHLLRTLGAQYQAPAAASPGSPQKPQQRTFDSAAPRQYPALFDTFKLVYTNASGAKTETTLPQLLAKMEGTFLEHELDLASCLEKAVCVEVYKSGENMRLGYATGLQKIVDGISNWAWLRPFMHSSFLGEAIEAGRLTSSMYSHCDVKYPTCKWAAPGQKLLELMNTYVKFT